MAVSTDRYNLLDRAKLLDPDGTVAQVAEVMSETNTALQDAPILPSNAPMGNRVTRRTSLPTTSTTRFNQGTAKSKASTEQVNDSIGMFSNRSEMDVKFRVAFGDAAFTEERRLQDMAHEESLSQTLAESIFYGSELTLEGGFTGLQPRLNTLGVALSGSRVVSAGGSGSDNTSLYVVDWSERFAHLIHPRDGQVGGDRGIAGLHVKQLGEVSVNDADGNPFTAMVTEYLAFIGLTVKDRRHIGRLANIDVSEVASSGLAGYSGADIIIKLTDLLSEMPDPGGANRVIYAHNRIWAALWKQALAKSNAALSLIDYMGKPNQPAFWGFPIRRMDRISLAESAVS